MHARIQGQLGLIIVLASLWWRSKRQNQTILRRIGDSSIQVTNKLVTKVSLRALPRIVSDAPADATAALAAVIPGQILTGMPWAVG